ncbi:hypothetical protein AJ79_08136 [Helicocarpus griseus UAMH5409]|uniref:Retinol dehydrogenase 12 n=1 Tax=Helicocarpus griseus UAMH5409 TaxID=1447875 RepID=A0A2B7WV86_9EURO|nr:hypothetical protein AJ79_08136 [Helicocarpus griseus UAMH5409]
MASRTGFGEKTGATDVAEAFYDQVKGLTVLVTGVNPKGIGGATVKAIAQHDAACVIITGRSQEKLDEIIKDLSTNFPRVRAISVSLDLASQRSVRNAAVEISKAVDAIDVVINNAGVMCIPQRELSEDGFEMHLATNHIGHFLLTNLLMDKIRQAAVKRPGSTRIVNVTSAGYNFSAFRFQDYNFEGHPVSADEGGDKEWLKAYGLPEEPVSQYVPLIAYGQSKTANLLFTTYLAKHLASYGITSFVVHPGVIRTELLRYMSEELVAAVTGPVTSLKTQDQGAATSVVAALDPALKDHSGAYMSDCQVVPAAAYAVDQEAAEKLWKLTETFVGQEFKL